MGIRRIVDEHLAELLQQPAHRILVLEGMLRREFAVEGKHLITHADQLLNLAMRLLAALLNPVTDIGHVIPHGLNFLLG